MTCVCDDWNGAIEDEVKEKIIWFGECKNETILTSRTELLCNPHGKHLTQEWIVLSNLCHSNGLWNQLL